MKTAHILLQASNILLSKMSAIKRIFYFICLCALLNACSSTASEASLPDWISNPPANSAQYVYAVGEGQNLAQAQKDALAMIAGYFESSVSQQYSDYQSVVNQKFNRSTKMLTSVETSKVSLSNVEFIQRELISDQHFVLARLDLPQYQSVTSSRLAALDSKLRRWFSSLSSKNYISVASKSMHIFDTIDEAHGLLFTMKTLNSEMNINSYSAQYNQYLSELNGILDNGELFFYSNMPDSEISKALKDYISGVGAKLMLATSDKLSNMSDTDSLLKVEIDVKSTEDERKAITSNVGVKLTTYHGTKEIGNTSLQSRGRSYSSETESIQQALQGIKIKLQKSELHEILGLPHENL